MHSITYAIPQKGIDIWSYALWCDLRYFFVGKSLAADSAGSALNIYDGNGNLVSKTDPDGRFYSY